MDKPEKFVSVPTEIEAIQWTGKNADAVKLWLNEKGDYINFSTAFGQVELWVAANEAWLSLEKGEWIVKDSLGFYPCKDEVFQRKYVPALTTVVEYGDNTPSREFRGISLDHYPGL